MSYFDKIEKYYKKKSENIDNIIKKRNEYNAIFKETKNNEDIIELYDKKGKLILKATYQVIGIFNNKTSMWTWGYAIDLINKESIKKSKKILEFNKELKKNNINNKLNYKAFESLDFYTSNETFSTSKDKLEIFSKLMIYLTNGEWFLKIIHNSDSNNKSNNITVLEYIMIENIIQIGS